MQCHIQTDRNDLTNKPKANAHIKDTLVAKEENDMHTHIPYI